MISSFYGIMLISFISVSLVKFFLDPFNLFWLLLVTSIGLFYLKNDRFCRLLAAFSMFWFLIISTPLLPCLVLGSLEIQYSPVRVGELTEHKEEYHILILGGGHGFDERLPPNSLLSSDALGRLAEGLRLHRQIPDSKLVFSGFSAGGGTTQAEILQQTALLLGVSENETILQSEPSNTFEEAKCYAGTYGNTHPLIVVGNASQMPRAVEVFKRFGTDPIPSPANFRLKDSRGNRWLGLPSVNNIEYLKTGIYEYAGILWYRFRK